MDWHEAGVGDDGSKNWRKESAGGAYSCQVVACCFEAGSDGAFMGAFGVNSDAKTVVGEGWRGSGGATLGETSVETGRRTCRSGAACCHARAYNVAS